MTVERWGRLRRALALVLLGMPLASTPVAAEIIEERLAPTADANQADLQIEVQGSLNDPFFDTSFVQSGSQIRVSFDTETRDLEFVSATINGSDVSFDTPGFPFALQKVEALNILVVQDQSAPLAPKVRIEENGDFMSQLVLPVFFSALVRINDGPIDSFTQEVDIFLDGRLVDAGEGLVLENLSGDIPDLEFEAETGSNTLTVTVSGSVLFNFSGGIFQDGFESGSVSEWSSSVP